MLGQLTVTEPKIRGLVWFDSIDPRPSYRHLGINITSSRSSLSAFASAINAPSYLSNTFRDFVFAPIPTPPGQAGVGRLFSPKVPLPISG
jgi:hypothetical protein